MQHMIYLFNFILTAISVPLSIKIAHKYQFIDNPQASRFHKKPTPTVGGIAIFVPIVISTVILLFFNGLMVGEAMAALLGGAVLMVITGFIDDIFTLSASRKFFLQTLGALLIVFFLIPTGSLATGMVIVPLSLIAAIGLVNAFNFLDNMDGVTAGVSAVIAILFFFIGYREGLDIIYYFSGLVATGCIAFLIFNFHPAKIFLGDTGSHFLGFTITALAFMTLFPKCIQDYSYFAVLLLALSYPIFDISFVSITRHLEGRKFYQGGKDHSTHRLYLLLGRHSRTAILIYIISMISSVLTFYLYFNGTKLLRYVALLVAVLFYSMYGIMLYTKTKSLVKEGKFNH